MQLLVLGGAGAMGREIVRQLLELRPRPRVSIADVRCDFFENDPPAWVRENRRRLSWKPVNLLREPSRLIRLLRGHTAMINATTHHLNLPAMKTALAASVHYIDLGGLFHYTRRQLKLSSAFERKKCLAVLGMGCAPGLSNLLAVHAAEELDQVEEVHIKVGSCDFAPSRLPPGFVVVPYAIQTIREELTLKPWVFSRGRFKAVLPMSGKEAFAFPAPVGRQVIFNTLHSEVATLPLSFSERGVREASFKIGFEEALIRALLHPRKNTKFVLPPVVNDIEITCALVKGSKRGRKKTVMAYAVVRSKKGLSAGTLDTAIPPAIVAGLLPQLKVRGVLPPEKAVPVAQFFREARRRGIVIRRRDL